MKGMLSVIVILGLIGLGVWLLFGQPPKPEDSASSRPDVIPSEAVGLSESGAPGSITGTQLTEAPELTASERSNPSSQQQHAEKLAQAKKELDKLILEYNEHLSDPESRAEVQQRMERLLEQYNELALPVALAKMNEN